MLQEVCVPVLCAVWPDAMESGAGLCEASCGAVSAGVGVVSTCDVLEVQRVDPWRESGCRAGGREEDVEAVHLVELVCGEGIDRALEEERVLRGSLRDPESAAGFAGSGSHAPEGASWSGSDDFGAGTVAVRVASEEDCVGSTICGEDVLPEAGADEVGSDAASAFEILPDFGAWIGAACGLLGSDASEDADCVREAASCGVEGEVDGAAAFTPRASASAPVSSTSDNEPGIHEAGKSGSALNVV